MCAFDHESLLTSDGSSGGVLYQFPAGLGAMEEAPAEEALAEEATEAPAEAAAEEAPAE